jgi:hypothetical protein
MKALEEGVRTTGQIMLLLLLWIQEQEPFEQLGVILLLTQIDQEMSIKSFVSYPADHEEPIRYLALGKTLFVESPTGTIKKFFENRLVTLNELRDEDAMLLEMADPTKFSISMKIRLDLMAHQDLPLTSPYEPGSIFKGLTVAIGLDTGEIEPDMMYEDRGKVKIDEFTISNLDNDKCQGWHNFRNALNYQL